jgi:hypothetical protein
VYMDTISMVPVLATELMVRHWSKKWKVLSHL